MNFRKRVFWGVGANVGQERPIAGFENRRWYERGLATSVRTTVDNDIVIDPTRGEGVFLYDVDGNAYLDFGFVGADNFGFGSFLHPMRQAIYDVSPVPQLPEQDIFNFIGILAKEELVRRTPVNGRGIANGESSGGMANECTLKLLTRKHSNRQEFTALQGAFHGRPLGALALMDRKKCVRVAGFPKTYTAFWLPFPSTSLPDPVRTVEETLNWLERNPNFRFDHVNALFLELVQGEGGINVAHPEAMRLLVETFRAHGSAIVIDEVQTGMGRTGTLWSYLQYGFTPDIVTMGKSLSGGVRRLSALVCAEQWDFDHEGTHSSTFGFEPADAAAMLAAFEVIDQKRLCERAQHIGEILGQGLKRTACATRAIREVRGIGAMWGVEFTGDHVRTVVRERCRHFGLLMQKAGLADMNPTLRIMPPLIITDEELLLGLGILENVLRDEFPKLAI